MPFLWAIAALVGSFFLAALVSPKGQDAKPASQSQFDFPQIDESTPQAVIFGDCWTSDWQVLWYGNLRNEALTSGGGKKGGSSDSSSGGGSKF